MVAIFHFLYWLFRLVSVKFYKTVDGEEVAEEFPRTLKHASKLAGVNSDPFTDYIVCPKCEAIFAYELGYTLEGGNKIPNRCPFVEYPNHPHSSKRQPCDAFLMKTVKTRSGKTTVKPYKVFAYQPLETAVTNLANRTGFIDLCENWRERWNPGPDGVMCDIYDGHVWKDFQKVGGLSFLESKFSWCFTLNVDFFQPFSHTRKWHYIIYTCCICSYVRTPLTYVYVSNA